LGIFSFYKWGKILPIFESFFCQFYKIACNL
jgi:hypothetical protein